LQNALKFSRNIKDAYIEVGSKKLNDKYVEYWVKDNGIGIEPEDQGKVFSIFYRVKDTGREGHGVGLAIVKKIVQHYGGQMRLESRKGAGATFFFTLLGTN
jgi:signal transduction histidine kinase